MSKMNKEIKWGKLLSVATLLVGIVLLIYMILIEDEPGALPFFFIVIGTIWSIINQLYNKKQVDNIK